jgi:hypothetical protein
MPQPLPHQAKKYFWGDDLDQLNWEDHQQYIVQTLLEKGDFEELSWLFKQISKQEVLKMLPQLKLSKKSRNFWKVYLA